MTGKRAVVAVGAAVLLVSAGCATCGHESAKLALDAGPTCDTPTCHRQKVYVFMVNGLIPCGSGGMAGLRDQIAAAGFPKTAYGQLIHAGWLAGEMRRVHADDPCARFVVIGYDLGGSVAARLTAAGAAEGLPVDALVLLDPTGKIPMADCGVRTILVRSAAGGAAVPHTESVVVPDAGHFRLPTHPVTVGVVCELLTEVAGKVALPPPIPMIEPDYEHAPVPLPMPRPVPDGDPAWNFLLDQTGGVTPPLPEVLAAPKPAYKTPFGAARAPAGAP
jgi:hypothetical protein